MEQVTGSYCKIIQQAKALAAVGKCMMGAACHIQGNTVVKSMLTTIYGSLRDHAFLVHKLCGEWKSNSSLFRG